MSDFIEYNNDNPAFWFMTKEEITETISPNYQGRAPFPVTNRPGFFYTPTRGDKWGPDAVMVKTNNGEAPPEGIPLKIKLLGHTVSGQALFEAVS